MKRIPKQEYSAQFNAAQLLVIDDLFLRKLPVGAGDDWTPPVRPHGFDEPD